MKRNGRSRANGAKPTRRRKAAAKGTTRKKSPKPAPEVAPLDGPFRVGDRAVYPAHGVAEIERVETKKISGKEAQFYVLRILESDTTIMLPTANADSAGLRDVISKAEVEEIYDILRERDVPPDTQTWNRRYREYMDKIKTGSAHEIAEVMRDLYLLKGSKDLSFSERKMLEKARALLVQELSLAEQRKEQDVERKLNRIFAS